MPLPPSASPAADDASDLIARVIGRADEIGAERAQFEPGDIVLQELSTSESFYIVVEGTLQIVAGPERADIATLHSGEIVGELAFIDDHPHTATAVAKTQTVLLAISRTAFSRLATVAPELAYGFNEHLLRTVVSRLRSHIDLQRRHQEQEIELRKLADQLSAVNLELSEALDQTRATQAELIAASRLATVGQLASGMAHELNSPVAAILRASAQLGGDLRDILQALSSLGGGRADAYADFVPLLERLFETASQPDLRSLAEIRQAKRGLETEILKRHPSIEKTRLDLLTRLAATREGIELLDVMESVDEPGLRAATSMIGLAEAVRSLAICGERIDHVVRALQGYSRVDQEETSPTDIREGIDDTLVLFTHAFKSGVALETDLKPVPAVQARAAELNQVWTNIVQNAIQAMDRTGTLTVATRPEDGGVAASFHDTGSGIPADNLERIFDLNFSTRRGSQRFGFGVGLAVANTIVESHGGRITVSSRPGDTTFLIWLPQSAATAERDG